MAGQERKHRFTLFHVLSILLLIMLVMPASPVLADPAGDGPAYRDQLAQGSGPSARPSGAPEQAGPSAVPPGTNMVADGGFETAYPNAYWGEYDSYDLRVICNAADCGTSSARGPRSGTGWAWMGAVDAADISGVYQPIAFPACTTVTLRFYLKMVADSGAGGDETMRVYIDSTPVYGVSATSKSYFSSYRLVTVDVSAFADNAAHYLAFESQITGAYYVSFNLDDISLIATASSGCIIQGNTSIGGVTLSATGGYSAVSNASTHNYVLTVPVGWSGTVTPSKAGVSLWDPEFRTYSSLGGSQSGQDFTPLLTISGNAGTSPAAVEVSNYPGHDTIVDGAGNYVVTVPYGWTGTVTPMRAGYGFIPSERSYQNLLAGLTGQDFTTCASNATVDVGGSLHREYCVDSGGRVTPQYPVLNGPVDVNGSVNLFASERVHNATGFVNEVMGVPDNQLTNEYWFPWYDNLSMQTWLLVGNPSGSTTAHVHVYIAGNLMDPPGTPAEGVAIDPGHSWTPQFPVLNGPVHITSDINVFASERVHTAQGFVQETLGYPNNRLVNKYWFPWYDNLSMQTWLLVGNPSTTTTAHVHAYIAGELMDPPGTPAEGVAIDPGHSWTPQFPRLNGPVRIESDIPVFTSERVHNATGFVQETMGYPDNKLALEYWFPWYDNLTMQTWLLVGNPSETDTAHVHIYIAGEDMEPLGYNILPGDRITPTYARLNGPVHIVSDKNVFASERVHTAQGFVQETMGMPNDQLTTRYWFPWYDNLSMQSWILVGRP